MSEGVAKKIVKWCGKTLGSMRKQVSTETAYKAGKAAGRQLRSKKP